MTQQHLALAAACLALLGCTSVTTNYYGVQSEPLLVVGDQPPAGYPRTQVSREPAGCVQTTESWLPQAAQKDGQAVWLRQIRRQQVDCK